MLQITDLWKSKLFRGKFWKEGETFSLWENSKLFWRWMCIFHCRRWLKDRGHRWDVPTIWKIIILKIHIKRINQYVQNLRLSLLQSEPAEKESRKAMSFLIVVGGNERLSGFKFPLEEKTGRNLPQSWKTD